MTAPSVPLPLSQRVSAQQLAAELLMALLAGWLAYQVSCWLVTPLNVPRSFGEQWMWMSRDPFALTGELPHRILGPLLAWLLGQGGEGFPAFVRGLNVLLLATVFLYCRQRRLAAIDATLVALAIAITAPVQMYKEHWVGYVDPLCYSLFLGSMMAASRPVLFWGLFLANLFNHELAVFLLPWLWYLRRQHDGRSRADAVGAAVAISLYAVFYFVVKAKAEPRYSVDYFLANPLFPGGTFAVWVAAVVHWVVGFGPMLTVLAWHRHSRRIDADRWHLLLVLGGILVIFCIAFDWSRHANLLLLPLVIASASVLAGGGRNRLVYAALVVTSACLFAVPKCRPWSATAWPTREITEPALLVSTGVVIENPNTKEVGFGPLSSAINNWLPEAWHVLWPILLILAAIWSLGFALARWRCTAVEPSQRTTD